LHIHTIFSSGDSAIVPEQTVELVAEVAHARVLGISDHADFISDADFLLYSETVKAANLYLGVEVSGSHWIAKALEMDVDYYIYHCADKRSEYRGAEKLLETAKPVVIAHPLVMGTNLNRIPSPCLIEVNNRYVWQCDWRAGLTPFTSRFQFVISSDAHQPSWLNQNVARHVARELGIQETLLFPENMASRPG
jgi:histidinol phosphatase-like PHP family hydrolase